MPPIASGSPAFVDIWSACSRPRARPTQRRQAQPGDQRVMASADLAPVLEPDGTLPEAVSRRRSRRGIEGRAASAGPKEIASDPGIVADIDRQTMTPPILIAGAGLSASRWPRELARWGPRPHRRQGTRTHRQVRRRSIATHARAPRARRMRGRLHEYRTADGGRQHLLGARSHRTRRVLATSTALPLLLLIAQSQTTERRLARTGLALVSRSSAARS